jgi:hypothetical protein
LQARPAESAGDVRQGGQQRGRRPGADTVRNRRFDRRGAAGHAGR